MFRRRREPSVVTDVAAQTQQAAALAATEYQDLLADPRTNPAVRAHHDTLRDAQQRDELEAAHRRAVRRGRVADRRAAHAERTLEAIAAARESISPARAVTTLQQGRRRFLGGALAASVALSAGSAMGLAAVSVHTGGPALAGYLAEVCLTVMTTVAILYRSHIDQASAAEENADAPTWEGWRHRVLLALVVAPLATSIVANLAGWVAGAAVSPINALCALGAGAAGAFAFLVSDVSSRAVRTNAAAVNDSDEDELRQVATEGDPFADEHAQASSPEAWVRTQAEDAASQIEQWLAERGEGPEGGAAPVRLGPAHDGPHGAARARAEDGGASTERVLDARTPAQTDADQGDARGTERASAAARERGAATRSQVAAILARTPDARTSDIATELGVHPSTVRRARSEMDGGAR
ncbi:hypothetical protein F4561_005604 [Lipingzhangella halophila]|uniref:Uncharacterized protein n=1 Tax=Lipingzhangella halophila TaxID=1783352 RepID=A0A7W7RC37_9ACTN|nr:hypothetical protein [Lipingzhangella halophila]MBB4929194.1 hypothetical protein [Lipingzhangella halophila]MBB4934710.1 hypothetical protein [Lipingzhangella halophila]